MTRRWPFSRGNGVTFRKEEREPFPWPAALILAAIVVGCIVILGLLIAMPILTTKGM